MSKISYTMLVSFCGNTFLAFFKIISGLLCNCCSLISDGLHTFSDLTTDVIVILQDNNSNKEKRDYIFGIVSGLVIIILGFGMIYYCLNRSILMPNIIAVLLSIVTIIFKYVLTNYMYKKSKYYNNQILLTNANESRLDILSSLLVLISIIFSRLFIYSDLICTILVSIIVILTGLNMIFKNSKYILGVLETNNDYIERIKNVVLMDDSIKELLDVNITKFNDYYLVSCNLLLNSDLTLMQANKITRKVKTRLKNYDKRIDDVVVHINLSK